MESVKSKEFVVGLSDIASADIANISHIKDFNFPQSFFSKPDGACQFHALRKCNIPRKPSIIVRPLNSNRPQNRMVQIFAKPLPDKQERISFPEVCHIDSLLTTSGKLVNMYRIVTKLVGTQERKYRLYFFNSQK